MLKCQVLVELILYSLLALLVCGMISISFRSEKRIYL